MRVSIHRMWGRRVRVSRYCCGLKTPMPVHATLSLQLSAALDRTVPVLINDSLGRPWRMGTVGFAIGTAGFEPVWDQVGEKDLDGRIMKVTAPAIADALAAAAHHWFRARQIRVCPRCGSRAAICATMIRSTRACCCGQRNRICFDD